ncbi:MAG: murein hydrolase activator EnvC family protein [Sphingobium sp.]
MRIVLITLPVLATVAALGFAVHAPAATTIAEEQRSLVKARRDAAAASARSAQLERDAAAERDEAARAEAQAAAVAARIQSAEAEIAAAEARIRILARLQAAQRARLAERQQPIIRLTAALQTMARRPSALALVQPGSTADLVHVRSLLATIVPVVEERTSGLRDEIVRSRALRRSADLAALSLRKGRERLQSERLALAKMEAAHRQRSRQFADNAMFESDRAIALGERARDIVDLMSALDEQAGVREALQSLPGPLLRPVRPGGMQAPPDDPRLTQPRNPPYRLPVFGEVVTGLGEVSASGVRAKGLTLETRPGAQVVAPTRGRIAYAADYRGFGKIVIIDHGQGWTSLITNLAGLDVKVGDVVAQGSPLGRADAGRRPTVTVELRRNGRPVDITPLVS